jgi:hypothetical protein
VQTVHEQAHAPAAIAGLAQIKIDPIKDWVIVAEIWCGHGVVVQVLKGVI